MAEYALDLLESAKRGDLEASEKLIVENSGLIWSIVKRYFGRGVDSDDLYQLGCLGILKAIQGYDPSYGTRFSTYAVPKISGEIRRFLRDDGSVKVSRSLKERAAVIYNARASLEQRLGREPHLSELEQETGLSPEEIAIAESATGGAESINSVSPETGLSLESMLCDSTQEEKLLEHVALREAIRRLPEKERIVIGLRYFKGMTQEQSAKVLGVSQVQVSRLERKAVEHLREGLAELG